MEDKVRYSLLGQTMGLARLRGVKFIFWQGDDYRTWAPKREKHNFKMFKDYE